MGKLTFGFLDPSRGANQNYDLGARLRDQAIKSFKAQTVCDLSHIAGLSMDDLQNALFVRVGDAARRLRDSY